MNGIPAYCDHCKKTIIAPNLFGGPGAANFTFENSGISCPHCGRMARILNGTYSYQAEVVKLLSGPKSTVERLRELERILKDANKNKSSSEEIAQTIRKELPEFSPFADWLKQHGPTIGSAVFAAVFAAIVHLYTHFDNKQTALKTAAATQSPPQVIYQTTNNTTINNIKNISTSSSYHRPKQFRNKKGRKSQKNN
jgi:glutaredoxin